MQSDIEKIASIIACRYARSIIIYIFLIYLPSVLFSRYLSSPRLAFLHSVKVPLSDYVLTLDDQKVGESADDDTLSHINRLVHQILNEMFESSEIACRSVPLLWPSRLPILIPVDLSLWRAVKNCLYNSSGRWIIYVEQLKHRIDFYRLKSMHNLGEKFIRVKKCEFRLLKHRERKEGRKIWDM